MSESVRVGIGVIIVNEQQKILIGKRIGSPAPYHSIPGGHIERGETFEHAAIREIQEETNLIIEEPRVIAVTNNLKTFHNSGKHYISIILVAEQWHGQLQNKEPHKCTKWQWVDPTALPQPHFDASQQGVTCYLHKVFYTQQNFIAPQHENSIDSYL